MIGIMQNIFILYRQSVLDAQDIKPAMVFALGILRKLGAMQIGSRRCVSENADNTGRFNRSTQHTRLKHLKVGGGENGSNGASWFFGF